MPAIHGSLTDQDFDAYGKLAESKGMTRTELTSALAKAEILKRAEFLKATTGADGAPIVPQHERV